MSKIIIGRSWCCKCHHLGGIFAVGNENVRNGGVITTQSRAKSKGGDCCKDVPQTKGRIVKNWPERFDPDHPPWRPECPSGAPPRSSDLYRIKVPEVVVPPLPPSNAKPMLACAKQQLSPCGGKPAPDPPICPVPPKKPFPWIYPIILAVVCLFLGLLYKYYVYVTVGPGKPEKIIWRQRRKNKRPQHDVDIPKCVQYLIVGTGSAGWAAYRSIMQHDDKAKVFFVTKEDAYPYKRSPMSRWMWWNADPPDPRTLNYTQNMTRRSLYYAICKTFMDPQLFYRKRKGPAVSIASGYCVLRVDADNHVAFIKTYLHDRAIYYERCLLAVGAKAKKLSFWKHSPTFVRERIQTFRTLRDLEAAYRKVKEAKHVTIVGAGPLGCELAWYIAQMHQQWVPPPDDDYKPPEVLLMYKGKGVLPSVLPAYLGQWAAEKIRCQGVNLMPECQVYDAFETKDGRLELTLSNGKSIVTDYVLTAIGTTPRIDIAERSDLELDPINKGYLVNTELQARTHLYVAGDAASVYSQLRGVRRRMEHLDNAEDQGFIAGANMTGYWIPCNIEPHWWFDLGNDISMEAFGETGACLSTVALFKPCDEIVKEEQIEREIAMENIDRPCFQDSGTRHRYQKGMIFYLRNDIIVGIIFWNMGKSFVDDKKEVVTEMIRAEPTVHDIHIIADMLGYGDIECEWFPPGPVWKTFTCIDQYVSQWMELDGYKDYEKLGVLSTVETPETVVWVNDPIR